MQLIGISTAHCFGRCQINLVVWGDIFGRFGVINRGFWRLTIEWWYEGSIYLKFVLHDWSVSIEQ